MFLNITTLELFDIIKSKKQSGEFKILVNEVIIKEWKRNKKIVLDTSIKVNFPSKSIRN